MIRRSIILYLIFAGVCWGEAYAAFEEGHLIMSIYNGEDNEIGFDLGDLDDLRSGNTNALFDTPGLVHIGSDYFVEPDQLTLADLGVGIYAYEAERVATDGWEHYYFASPIHDTQIANTTAVSSYVGAVNYPRAAYQENDEDGNGVSILPVSQIGHPTRYDYRMNLEKSAPGAYNNLPTPYNAAHEPNLSVLMEDGGYLDLYVYEFNYMDEARQTEDWDMIGEVQFFIRLQSDGSILLNPQQENRSPAAITDREAYSGQPEDSITISGHCDDPDGADTITECTWRQDENDAVQVEPSITFPAQNRAVANFVAPADGGTFIFWLTATDSSGASSTARTTVTIERDNRAPTAHFVCPETTMTETEIAIDGSQSSDEDGDTLEHQWVISRYDTGEEFTTLAGTNPSFTTPAVNGALSVQLTVSDLYGAQDVSRCIFNVVTDFDQLPEAVAGPDQEVYSGQNIALDGANSTAAGGRNITTWEWRQLDIAAPENDAGTIVSTEPAVSIQAPSDVSINYIMRFQLFVADSDGLVSQDDMDVTIIPYDAPDMPAINFPPDGGTVATLTPTLSVSALDDPNLRYRFRIFDDENRQNLIAEVSDIYADGTAVVSWEILNVVLEEDGEYYWEAAAGDDIAFSDWRRAQFTINTQNDPPEAPLLIQPAGGSVSSSPEQGFIFANAVDTDSTPTYMLEVYESVNGQPGRLIVAETDIIEGTSAVDDQGQPLSRPENNQTSYYSGPLDDDMVYLWRVCAHDEESQVCSDYSEFTIDMGNSLPSNPIPVSQDGREEVRIQEVTQRDPRLMVRNAVDTDAGDLLVYHFEITQKTENRDCREIFDECEVRDDCFIVNSGAVNEGEVGTEIPGGPSWRPVVGDDISQSEEWDSSFTNDWVFTSHPDFTGWVVPYDEFPGLPLLDNTWYCWRVMAADSEGGESDWVHSELFINTKNDAPSVPRPLWPENDGKVSQLSGALLEVVPAFDPDGDTLTYIFELYDDMDSDETIAVASQDSPQWELPVLEDSKDYYWRVMASDPEGGLDAQHSEWSPRYRFTVYERFPYIPEIHSPVQAGTTASLTPILSIRNPIDQEADEIVYEFELYADSELTAWVSKIAVAQQNFITSWDLSVPETEWNSGNGATMLVDGSHYYWRARAVYGFEKSNWTSTARFLVKTQGGAPNVKIERSQMISAVADVPQKIEVIKTNSPIYRTSVIVPPGSIRDDCIITIGYALNTQALPPNIMNLGPVLSFTPTDIQFRGAVYVNIPFSPENAAMHGDKLRLFQFDVEKMSWETVDAKINYVDHKNGIINCEMDHFSIYMAGVEVDVTEEAPAALNDGGGKSSSGCFMTSLLSANR